MALFERDGLPSRSALSRFLAPLTVEPDEALRTCFLADLLVRQLCNEEQIGGLWDRAGTQWRVFDVDGTREAAQERALPQTADRPAAQRRLRPLGAGVLGTQARGSRSHPHHRFAGAYPPLARHVWQRGQRPVSGRVAPSGGGPSMPISSATSSPPPRAVVRLDGQYGTAAVLADLAGLSYVTHGLRNELHIAHQPTIFRNEEVEEPLASLSGKIGSALVSARLKLPRPTEEERKRVTEARASGKAGSPHVCTRSPGARAPSLGRM